MTVVSGSIIRYYWMNPMKINKLITDFVGIDR